MTALDTRRAVRDRVENVIGHLDLLLDSNTTLEQLRKHLWEYRSLLRVMQSEIDHAIRDGSAVRRRVSRR